MKEEVPLYVGIENPQEFRRSLLEASKSVIRALQRYEGISGIRERKFREMERYKQLANELAGLLRQLKNELPNYNLKSLPRSAAIGFEARPAAELGGTGVMAEERIKTQHTKKLTEVERLEQELGQIEEKLRSL